MTDSGFLSSRIPGGFYYIRIKLLALYDFSVGEMHVGRGQSIKNIAGRQSQIVRGYFGHSFVTKSVRFGRTELSLRLSKCSWRDLAIEKGSRACFLKNKRKKYDFSYGLEVEQRKKHFFFTKSVRFGRTELSLRLSGCKFGSLLHGHGPRV